MKAGECKNISQNKLFPENNKKEYQKHKLHEKQWQNNSEVNNILTVQQNTNENNETTESYDSYNESYDKNSVRKEIINLKNDIQEIKEALKSLLTKQ